MYLCSVVSKVSNYDSCQFVHFCVFIQHVILPDDAIKGRSVSGSRRN